MPTELNATPATTKRISDLTKTLLPEIGRLWKPVLDAGLDPQIWNLPDPRHKTSLEPALAFLESKFDPDPLGLAAIETLRFPEAADLMDNKKPKEKTAHLFLLTCFHAAANHLTGPSLAILEDILSGPKADYNDRAPHLVEFMSGANVLHFPGCSDAEFRAIAETMEFPPKTLPAIRPLLRRIASGDFVPHEDHRNQVKRNRVFAVLHALDELDYEHYRTAALHPLYARDILGTRLDPGPGKQTTKPDPKAQPAKPNAIIASIQTFENTCHHYALRFAREITPALDADSFAYLDRFHNFFGAEFLIDACAAVERLGLSTRDFKSDAFDTPQEIIARMAAITRLDENDGPAAIVPKLKKFKKETLETLVHRSGAGRDLMVAALGAADDKAHLFHEFLVGVVKNYGNPRTFSDPFENSPNPTLGVIPRDGIIKAAEGLKPYARKAVIKELHVPKVDGIKNAKFLFSAVFGDNEKQVRDSLKRFSQPAAKALGLLPLPDNKKVADTETEARYRAILEFQRGCKKFGTERQANSRAAAHVGLENLAQNAGYGDSERLAWAMEARIAGGGGGSEAPESQRVEIGDYTVVLKIESGRPSLFVEKKEKPLKSIPAAIRKTIEYKALRKTADHLKAQFARFRNRLEEMMARSEILSPNDLATMAKLPALRFLLTNLVLRSQSGTYGTYDPGKKKLAGLSNRATALGKGPFVIAHPHHFHTDGLLSDWQRELVHRRLVQPFKQVFRELYILTPAEEKSETSSARFAGRTLTSNVAARLFQSRGWLDKLDDGILIHKIFRAEGFAAVLELAEYGHYLTEMETIETGNLSFYPFPADSIGSGDPLSLTEIPPTIFSEVLRDIDLAASVAYVGDGYWTSSQTRVRRRDLLDAIVADFALRGVSTDGKYADVKGALASYRVHLDTGAIYIRGSNHICVVPDNSKATPDDIYLPFTAEDDPKLREIVSRILMLLNDDKIRDKTILDQIKSVS